MKRKISIPDEIVVARLRAKESHPYFTAMLVSLHPIESPGIGTMAVDRFGRLYFDPAYLTKTPDQELATTVLHEVMHLYLRHHSRLVEALEDPFLAKCAEWAKECAVNTVLAQSGCVIPENWVTPERFGLPPGLATEEYFDMLQNKLERAEGNGTTGLQSPGAVGGESASDGDPGQDDPARRGNGSQSSRPGSVPGDHGEGVDRSQGQGGSSHDGRQRPWEDGPPSDGQADPGDGVPQVPQRPGNLPGYDHGDLDVLCEYTSKQIEEWEGSHGRGSAPGGLIREARKILHPTVDPVARIESLLRHSLDCTYGYGLFTYRRPSRRQPPGGAIQPVHRKPVPSLLVIADTSGSMGERDLSLVLGAVDRVIQKLPDSRGVEVWAGDTHVAAVSRVFRPEQVELKGGRGTNMASMIQEAMDKPRPPDVVLVVSDGETGWPELPVEAKVIAALTRKPSWCPAPPAWIETVELRPEDN
jgi:predicted metal-dependent peptidase